VRRLNGGHGQDRVTDHRIGLTIKNVQAVLEGEALQDFLDALGKHQDQETLEEMLAELRGDAATT
jgi:peptide chain release factor 1